MAAPFAGASRAAAHCRLAASGRHLRALPYSLPLYARRAAGGCRPYWLAAAAVPAGTAPCGLALAVTWPWVADPAWGLAVAGRPSSSLPSLRKCSKNT
ncbi:hypothetical protein GW17_00050461 [Ensete ventricosum]|nr:hypothetical protein GW17_00050461 [Ensete ventricosum]RZS21839.1 hypothetical protein BHM03_00054535 [Ensete ventricosum]